MVVSHGVSVRQLRSGTAQLWVLLSRADRDRRADWSEWSWRLHFTELVCVNESVD